MEDKNYFIELNKIECKTEKKQSLTYISWCDAWTEIKKIHPTANYTIYENEQGFPFWESKFGIDVKVGVTINELEHIIRLPVMDGANNSMTDKRQEFEKEKIVYRDGKKVRDQINNCRKKEKVKIIIEKATTFDINKTIMRAFAKAIAMHGLGTYVFRGEDFPDDTSENRPVTNTVVGKAPIDNIKFSPSGNTALGKCKTCGGDLVQGKFGPYCKPCFIKSKN